MTHHCRENPPSNHTQTHTHTHTQNLTRSAPGITLTYRAPVTVVFECVSGYVSASWGEQMGGKSRGTWVYVLVLCVCVHVYVCVCVCVCVCV